MSATTTKVSPTGGADAPKHRACDECRTRKLACSKEPDGCGRCKREGITCHYSAQKPMGRPRKRPHVEEAHQNAAEPVAASGEDSGGAMDVDWSFLDAETPSLSFLDLLGPDFSNTTTHNAPNTHQPTQPAAPPPVGEMKALWNFGAPDIDFGAAPIAGPPPNVAIDNTSLLMSDFMDPSLLQQDTPPGLTNSANTPDSQPQSQSSTQPVPGCPNSHSVVAFENKICGCLAAMYLALDSLQHLPGHVGPAMRITRNAARTAHDTTQCPSCSPPDFADVHMRPPVQAFQNMMLLGALLPTIANAYNRILALVDDEAARADADRRRIAFSLEEYGGLWGHLAVADKCGAADLLEGNVMEPVLWRRTVRALLRVDVYGINSAADGAEQAGCLPFVQIGLKDIIMLMDERSRTRHEAMDAAVAAGVIEHPEAHGHLPMAPGEKHTCQRIIDIAKRAIDDLVIA